MTGLHDAVQVCNGFNHGCVRHSDGRVTCWGNNWTGAVGDFRNRVHGLEPLTVSGVADAVDITCHVEASCAVIADGTVKCWGRTARTYPEDWQYPTQVVGFDD